MFVVGWIIIYILDTNLIFLETMVVGLSEQNRS